MMTRRGRNGAGRVAAARTTRGVVAGSLAAAWLSACAVGPNFVPPEAPPVTRYTKEPLANPSAADTVRTRRAARRTRASSPAPTFPGQWWTLFHSKALNRLVEQRSPTTRTWRPRRPGCGWRSRTCWPRRAPSTRPSPPRAPGAGGPGAGPAAAIAAQQPDAVSLLALHPAGGGLLQPRRVRGRPAADRIPGGDGREPAVPAGAAYLSLTANVVAAAIQEASLRAQIDATKKVIQAQTEVLALQQANVPRADRRGGRGAAAGGAGAVAAIAPAPGEAARDPARPADGLAGRLPSDEVSRPSPWRRCACRRSCPSAYPRASCSSGRT